VGKRQGKFSYNARRSKWDKHKKKLGLFKKKSYEQGREEGNRGGGEMGRKKCSALDEPKKD